MLKILFATTLLAFAAGNACDSIQNQFLLVAAMHPECLSDFNLKCIEYFPNYEPEQIMDCLEEIAEKFGHEKKERHHDREHREHDEEYEREDPREGEEHRKHHKGHKRGEGRGQREHDRGEGRHLRGILE